MSHQPSTAAESAIRAALRRLPKVDAVLARPALTAADVPRWALRQAVRERIDELRQAVLRGAIPASFDLASEDVCARARALAAPSLRRVINATGVVVHTNLGRAPLSPAALARVVELAGGYCNLEYELGVGRRGSRHGHVAALLTALTGADDAVVVNNNAAAVMLALSALASGREVIVSRGELVEIGGSFRVPDVMRLSGATLVEVGTTNKTRASDYERALSPDTGLLLKVHPSNFAIVGFTEEVAPAELATLCARAGVPTMMDLGSGLLLAEAELQAMGVPPEPGVRAMIAAGLDLVSFSGDKLLGGPQAGILCGRADLIDKLRRHPLMRALRPDKLTLAALEATLREYRDRAGPVATSAASSAGTSAATPDTDSNPNIDVPVAAMLAAPAAELERRAEAALALVRDRLAGPGPGRAAVAVTVSACTSTVGGGALPTSTLPSWGLALVPAAVEVGAVDIDVALRRADPPVIGRIVAERVVLDLRTVLPDDLEPLVAAVVSVVSGTA
ncbi:L-seryl-tRNA(Sec) selenium transferase [Haliangium sp.]|uniref:L-seryl-tRNA(Sec) selenium transferase n=1 Tax=Haliangium sp. TaxID=2663208 RepID=UPI003D14C243